MSDAIRWMKPHLLLVACALLGLTTGCAGCFGPDDDGNSDAGYFDLQFAAEEPSIGSWDPSEVDYAPVGLATGTTLDVSVFDYEPHTEAQHVLVDLEDVRVEPASVAEVVSTQTGHLTLRGVEEGEATVRFTAEADGEQLDDSFHIRVEDARDLSLDHYAFCGETYIAGYPFFTDFTLRGERLDLTGAGLYPVAVDPEGATRVDEEASNAYFITYEAPQPETTELTLRSELSSHTPSELPLRFVDPSEIAGFELSLLDRYGEIRVGESEMVAFLPLVDDRPLRPACSILPLQVRSTTPEICDLHSLGDPTLWRAAQSSRAATAVLVALAAGRCLLEVVVGDIPGLAAGAAATAIIGVDVEDPPEASRGGSGWDDDD